ncbi:MAG TPA: formate dehydrogenase accessory sulfurtransferase FdhD [Luteibacter sp.]|uniref:formate dehydrogenase accessory sulfurtransferase FdhD n=1 Tax=Luteibacter sp. TaxID=1886636 RepID=UPI002CF9E96C|nr:formate dehydrogenase accessory sulfurtransferase FdhD [Luteibacter sp.]HVI56738.1 formate dehydrogenase accessory sulfurtransferase FdhD [Luteibacter sp.]
MPAERQPPKGSAARPVLRVERGIATPDDDRLAEEVPVAMHVDGEPFAVMMATPNDLEDFARGFALTEGMVGAVEEIERIDVQEVLEGITVNIRTAKTCGSRFSGDFSAEAHSPRERLLPGRSGCGICGSRELEDVVRHPDPVGTGPTIGCDAIERALESLRAAQPINAFTGSVHAAAWALPDGALVCVREDVGRHNALDKLIGAMSTAHIDVDDGFVVITSRASYEMVTKAAVAGITIVVAISAPTALAVHLAADCGVTLIGFARPGRFNVYSRPQRII